MTKTVTTGKATDLITFTRSTTGTYLDSDGLLKTADINEPRIEYDADGNLKGLLIEEARTNIIAYSGDIGAWGGSVGSTTNVTLTENALTAPDGTQTADKVQRTVLDTSADYRQTKSVVSGNDYTFSIFAKADVQARLELDFSNAKFSSQDYVRFDVDTGTAYDSGTGATYSITYYGNGWYRFSLTATCTASGSTGVIVRVINNEPHYAWGAQLETGSFPTSYIPTSGSTVTRTADIATLALSKFGYNNNQSTILVEGEKTARTGVFTFVALHDGGSSDRVLLYYNNTILRGQIKSANNVVAQLTSEVAEGGKLGLAYKENDVAFTSNGGAVNTDTSAAMPAGLNTLAIGGYSYSTGQQINGHIKSVKYYPLRLSNEQLQALTQ